MRGDVIDIFPAHYEDRAWRVNLFGDTVENIEEFDPLTGHKQDELEFIKIYANSHYVTPRPTLVQAIKSIKSELSCGSTNSTTTAACWKRSGWSSAPPSISK